jgi:hypothetical protein
MNYAPSFVERAQMKRFFSLLRNAVLAALLLASVKGKASDFTLEFANTFSGTPPGGSPPYSVMFFESNAPGVVTLSISNLGLVGTEFITELDFNLNTNLNPNSLSFANLGSSGDFVLPAISTGVDFEKADGDGYYDVKFAFSTVAGQRFSVGDYVSYQISGIPGLTTSDFAFLSKPSNSSVVGPYYAAAHIQSIGGGNSGWVSPMGLMVVPEPAAGSLLAAAGFAFAGRFLFRRK